jgi:hypothetical protein
MYQPYSSTGQLAGPPQPPAPKPVLTAAKLTVALTWLIGLAGVWLLWRPAGSAFYKPQRFV